MFRYIGNKTRLLPFLLQRIRSLIGERGVVADIMAGTGCVSAELRRRGYTVIASDIMTYSYHHLRSQLLLAEAPSFSGLQKEIVGFTSNCYEKVIEYLNGLKPIKGFFFTEYSEAGSPRNGSPPRKYFSPENAARIDAIRTQLTNWLTCGRLTPDEESLLKHTLILAVNDVANISGTYGYFLSSYKANALSPMVMNRIEFIRDNPLGHRVLRGFAEDLSKEIEADLCYIDPPYMKRQYAANYHMLETLARGDSPDDLIGKSGLRNWWPQHSKLCTKTRGRDSFKQIIAEMKCPKFLVSYSEDGLFQLDELVALFEQFGRVDVERIEYSRFRSNQSQLSKTLSEYLISIERN